MILPNGQVLNREAGNFLRAFFDRVWRIPETGCWHWIGSTREDGYGELRINYKLHKAHRVAYFLYNGAIPVGYDVLHKCDNPCCVAPDHLFLGTQIANNRDRKEKGRYRRWGTSERTMRRRRAEANA